MLQLTRRTDYALRLLIHLAGVGDRRALIAQVAQAQAISRTHLMKIANELTHAGFTEAVRGRGGGIRLARDPGEINLGDVFRVTEPGCTPVDCTGCRLTRRCNLPRILGRATSAFLAVLQESTLADILQG